MSATLFSLLNGLMCTSRVRTYIISVYCLFTYFVFLIVKKKKKYILSYNCIIKLTQNDFICSMKFFMFFYNLL